MENRGTKIEGRDRAATAVAGEYRDGRVHHAAARRAVGRHEPRRARRRDRRAQVATAGRHGAARLPGRRRELVAAVPAARRRRPTPRSGSNTSPPWSSRPARAGRASASRSPRPGRRSTPRRPSCSRSRWPSPGGGYTGPIEAHDDRSQRIIAELAKPFPMSFKQETPLEDVVQVRQAPAPRARRSPTASRSTSTRSGSRKPTRTMTSTVTQLDLEGVPLRTTLKLLLNQLDLTYVVKDGLLTITSKESADQKNRKNGSSESARWRGGHRRHGR